MSKWIVPTAGDKITMNLNPMIYNNIKSSPYYKQDLAELNEWTDLVDEIYTKVDHVEPFLPKVQGQPSSAFCLMYKLFTIKPTENQLNSMLRHKDSPYIRAIAFLFLRYCHPMDKLYERLEPFLDDPEPIRLKCGAHQPMTTIGKFVRDLLVDNRYMSTVLPRIPVPIAKQIAADLKARPVIAADAEDEAEAYEEEAEEPYQPEAAPKANDARDRDRDRDHDRRSRSRSPRRDYGRPRDHDRRYDNKDRRSRSRSPPRDSNRYRDDRRYDDRDRDRRSRSKSPRRYNDRRYDDRRRY